MAAVILVTTMAQLVLAVVANDLVQFAGKNFVSRLVAYPLLMLAGPAAYAVHRGWRRRRRAPTEPNRPSAPAEPLPWRAFAWLMLPFLVDVTGNSLNLYDSVSWWDDANHFLNWFLLSVGVGLLLSATRIAPAWALGWLVAGLGALFAIGWELGEWYAFIRHGKELDTAYQDTLGDEALGSLGAGCAALLVTRLRRSAADRAG